MKIIEKGEEITINYQELRYESRMERQKELLEHFAFQCKCSECSLEGKALEENERLREAVSQRMVVYEEMIDNHEDEHGLRLVQEMLDLTRKLDLQGQVPFLLFNCYREAKKARQLGEIQIPEPNIIKSEALRYCEKYGDGYLHYSKSLIELLK